MEKKSIKQRYEAVADCEVEIQMKRVLLLLAILPTVLLSQVEAQSQIKIVHTFTFGNPFNYSIVSSPDSDSGMGYLLFPVDGSCYISGTYNNRYFLFNENWDNIFSTVGRFGSVYHSQSSHYILLGNNNITGDVQTTFWLFSKDNLG